MKPAKGSGPSPFIQVRSMEIDNDPLIKSVVRESVRQWKADVFEDTGMQESFDSYSRYI